MGAYDVMNYLLFTNPISSGAQCVASSAWRATSKVTDILPKKVEVRMAPPVPLWKLAAATGPYVKLAALSGASALILGAYGAHTVYHDEKNKEIFKTANIYHLFHSLALLGLPLCRLPYVAGTFFVSGITLFCGSCYYSALTNNKQFSMVTPFGGMCFIIGWLSMFI